MEGEETYYDSEGNKRPLAWLIKNEPEWLASRVRKSREYDDLFTDIKLDEQVVVSCGPCGESRRKLTISGPADLIARLEKTVA